MRHWVRFMVVIGGLSLLSGCLSYDNRPSRKYVLFNYPHATQASLTQSPHEHYQAVSNVAERDARALVDDLDLLFMTDRTTRLTRWHTR